RGFAARKTMPCRRTPSVVRKATSSEEEHAPLVEMCEGGVCPSAHATGHAMHNRSRAFDSNVRSVGIWQPLRWPSSLWCPQPAAKGTLMTRHLWYARRHTLIRILLSLHHGLLGFVFGRKTGQETGLFQFGFRFGQASAQGLVPLPGRGYILKAGGYAEDLPVGILEQHDVELDRDTAAVLGHRRDGKHSAAVLGDPAGHDLVVALPVTRAVLLGNDDVHGFAERLGGTPTEYRLRAGIPQPHDALAITDNDGDRTLFHNLFAEPRVSGEVIHKEPQGNERGYSFTSFPRRRTTESLRRARAKREGG